MNHQFLNKGAWKTIRPLLKILDVKTIGWRCRTDHGLSCGRFVSTRPLDCFFFREILPEIPVKSPFWCFSCRFYLQSNDVMSTYLQRWRNQHPVWFFCPNSIGVQFPVFQYKHFCKTDSGQTILGIPCITYFLYFCICLNHLPLLQHCGMA